MAFAVTSQAATLTSVINSFTLTDLIEDNSVKVLEIRSDEIPTTTKAACSGISASVVW